MLGERATHIRARHELRACTTVLPLTGAASVVYGATSDVFYNPAQVFNRDLTVLAIAQHAADRAAAMDAAAQAKEARRRASRDTSTALGAMHAARCAKAPGQAETPLPPTDPASILGIEILEALAATGLRSVRYAKEVPGVAGALANDLSSLAVQNMHRNITFNGLDPDIVRPVQGDAVDLLRAHAARSARVDVVDLDPYGTAAPFLDAAIGAVTDGGMMCITCTDMQTLAGGNLHTAWSRYASMPLKTYACHELALRMLLNAVASAASRQRASITPLLSLSVDFYIRVFVKVHQKPASVHALPAQLGFLRQCTGCHTLTQQPMARPKSSKKATAPPKWGAGKVSGAGLAVNAAGEAVCGHCGGGLLQGGPFWLGPLHHPPFVKGVLDRLVEGGVEGATGAPPAGEDRLAPRGAVWGSAASPLTQAPEGGGSGATPPLTTLTRGAGQDAGSNSCQTVAASRARLVGVLRAMQAELPHAPLHWDVSNMASVLKVTPPKQDWVADRLAAAGYATSPTHTAAGCLKTDAPGVAVWDAMRQWAAENPPSESSRALETPGNAILAQEVTTDFTAGAGASKVGGSKRRGMFKAAPTASWGPRSRAVAGVADVPAAAAGGEAAAPEPSAKKPRSEA